MARRFPTGEAVGYHGRPTPLDPRKFTSGNKYLDPSRRSMSPWNKDLAEIGAQGSTFGRTRAMRRTVSAIMVLGALALSAPSWPGSLYIPVVDAVSGNGSTLATQFWLTNPSAAQRQAHLTFLPENTNG